MSQLPDARQMFVAAEGAAADGDFASADELLRNVARIQEAELGPLHPDLASTLNNLAIVAEHLERWDDAESFYRRAATIAAASLPADHPMVAASRQNLEDFCRARELPVDRPAVAPPPEPMTLPGPGAFGREDAAEAQPRDVEAALDVDLPTPTPPLVVPSPAVPSRADESFPAPRTEPVAAGPQPPVPATGARRLPWVAVGVAVFLIAVLFATRPWSSRDRAAEPPTTEPATTDVPQPAFPPPAGPAAEPARTEETADPPPAAPADDRPAAVSPRPPARSAGAITLSAVELCRNFSASGRNWRCDPTGDPVAPGPIVLFTRVKSPADTSIVHRWYRGERLRQTVTLRIRANPAEGYRTYSRQTVTGPGDWRVEVSSVDGRTLHEQRFAVQ
jgi:hypothetical protein